MASPRRTVEEELIESERRELLGLSRVILEAICRQDAGALEPLLAPDFAFVGDSGRLDRRRFLDGVGASDFVAVASGFESIEIEVLGTSAVAAGVQRVEVELPDGTRAVSRQCFTDLFVKESGDWRVRFVHSVELAGTTAA